MSWSKYKEHIEQAVLFLGYIDNAVDDEQIGYYFDQAMNHIERAAEAFKEGLVL